MIKPLAAVKVARGFCSFFLFDSARFFLYGVRYKLYNCNKMYH